MEAVAVSAFNVRPLFDVRIVPSDDAWFVLMDGLHRIVQSMT